VNTDDGADRAADHDDPREEQESPCTLVARTRAKITRLGMIATWGEKKKLMP
jgi:hypothetical protein